MDKDEIIANLLRRIEMLEEIVYGQLSSGDSMGPVEGREFFVVPDNPSYKDGASHHEECLKMIDFMNSHHIPNERILHWCDNFYLYAIGDELSTSEKRTIEDIIKATKEREDVF